jgi:hypothetical protein
MGVARLDDAMLAHVPHVDAAIVAGEGKAVAVKRQRHGIPAALAGRNDLTLERLR